MASQKMRREEIKYSYQNKKDTPVLGREKIMKEEKEDPEKLLCPKAGTATSSPAIKTASQSNMNIVNTMLWMKRNAYEDSTIKKTAKRVKRTLQERF